MPGDRASGEDALEVPPDRRELFGLLAVGDASHGMLDDRAFVELLGHGHEGRSVEFAAMISCRS